MRAIIQRVSQASVSIDGECLCAIKTGLVALIGIAPQDDASNAQRMLTRLLGYRVFPDAQGRMNLSVQQIQGGLLLVPNFTVMADTQKGMRPSFTPAAEPKRAAALFDCLTQLAVVEHANCGFGKFGADMRVDIHNDGPITLILEA